MQSEHFHMVSGTPDMVAEELLQFKKLGVKHIQVRFNDFPNHEGLRLFIDKVIPRLKD